MFERQRPYITEAGPEAFDVLYRRRIESLQLLDQTLTTVRQQVSMDDVVTHALNLLIGVPSNLFLFDEVSFASQMCSLAFHRSCNCFAAIACHIINFLLSDIQDISCFFLAFVVLVKTSD